MIWLYLKQFAFRLDINPNFFTIKADILHSWLSQDGQNILKTNMDSHLVGGLMVKFYLQEGYIISMFYQTYFVSQCIKYKWR